MVAVLFSVELDLTSLYIGCIAVFLQIDLFPLTDEMLHLSS